MPRVNIYIRNDDWELWQSLADKPQWLHDALNLKTATVFDLKVANGKATVLSEKNYVRVGASVSGSVSNAPSRAERTKQQPTTCKNGHLLANGRCLQKGCKYS